MRPVKDDPTRAEFDAIETIVRYYEGRATASEMADAMRRAQMVRIASEHRDRQDARRGLPWQTHRPAARALGH